MREGIVREIFTQEALEDLFPSERADIFFEGIFGDAGEGAYDIRLLFAAERQEELAFEFHLSRRPGKCLACNLTYGLPEVFRRHPAIDIKGLVDKIEEMLGGLYEFASWRLGPTREISRELHAIPLIISLRNS